MKARVTHIEFKHKYMCVSYSVYDGEKLVDKHKLQYEFLNTGEDVEKVVRGAIRNSLQSYMNLSKVDRVALINLISKIEEDV